MTHRVIQISDLHVFSDPAARLKGIPTRELLCDVLSAIESSEPDLDALIITGDHTHDELESTYRDIHDLLTPWLDRLHLVPGNHDDRTELRRVFPDYVPDAPRLTFSVAVGDWRLIGLDSHSPGEVPGELGDEQIAWLLDEVARATGPVGLFLHHPPMAVGSDWMDALGLRDAEALQSALAAAPAVRFVACGHIHHEFHGRVGSVDVYSTPATGLQFDPAGSEPRFASGAPGYRVFHFDGTQYTTHVRRLSEIRFHPDAEA